MSDAIAVLKGLVDLGNSAEGKAALHRLLGMDNPRAEDVRKALDALPPIQPPKE